MGRLNWIGGGRTGRSIQIAAVRVVQRVHRMVRVVHRMRVVVAQVERVVVNSCRCVRVRVVIRRVGGVHGGVCLRACGLAECSAVHRVGRHRCD